MLEDDETLGGDGLGDALARLDALADPVSAVEARELRARWHRGALRVLLVGEAKRGKSMLGNALLGRPVLPSGVTPLTAVTTTVRAGGRDRVLVELSDGAAREEPLAALEAFVTERGNPSNVRRVTAVAVELATGLPSEGIELVDTPGMGSALEHEEAAEAALATMDVAVFVLTADPPISASERALLGRVRDLSVRTVVVLNKVDRLTAAEGAEALAFTREIVSAVLEHPVHVYPCCARDALAARQRGDTLAWTDSGVAALLDDLRATLAAERMNDLRRSISRGAGRLASEAVDRTRLTLRGDELLRTRDAGRVREFSELVGALARRREEALAVMTADLRQLRVRVDADMWDEQDRVVERARAAAQAALGGAALDATGATVEKEGRDAVSRAVRAGVEQWRSRWTHEASEALAESAARAQRGLAEQLRAVRDAAATLLDVHLDAPAPTVSLPENRGFTYRFEPAAGWNEPLTSAVRHRLPGRLGHRAVSGYLRQEAERLSGQHMGRARSDLSARIDASLQGLRRAVDEAYEERTRSLQDALADAEALVCATGADRDRQRVLLAERVAALECVLDDLQDGPPSSRRRGSP